MFNLSKRSGLDISSAFACRMRWTVRGIPRVPWNAEGVFDGISTFRLDNKGKVYEHQVCSTFPVARTECKLEHGCMSNLTRDHIFSA